MSRSKSRRRKRSLSGGRGKSFSAIAAHPVRAIVLGFLALILCRLVVITSLPSVFALTSPDWALQLNPEHPVALMTKAEQARTSLIALATEINASAKKNTNHRPSTKSGTVARYASSAFSAKDRSRAQQTKALRAEIRSLAKQIIVNDPLNARAFRLLAEVTDDRKRVRILMQAAAKRSRLESVAQFWLLNDAFSRKDYATALGHADILLRTRPALTRYVMTYLGQIAENPAGKPLIIKQLASAPSWRGAFFRALPRNIHYANTPLDLMVALKSTKNPVLVEELNPYLTFLIGKKLIDVAYNAWLQLLPEKQLATLREIYNPSFERDPTGLPFGWQVKRAKNSSIDYRQKGAKTRQRALHIGFGAGRVVFPTVSQIIMLAPGRYQFSVAFRGNIKAKRGLRWRVSCLYKPAQALAETDMLRGKVPTWRTTSLNFTISENGKCKAQTLKLVHDARSASEEFISGEVWFDDVKLTRLKN